MSSYHLQVEGCYTNFNSAILQFFGVFCCNGDIAVNDSRSSLFTGGKRNGTSSSTPAAADAKEDGQEKVQEASVCG